MPHTFCTDKQSLIKLVERKLKLSLRRLESCRLELALCQHADDLHHQGQLLQANLYRVKRGMKTVEIADWLHDGRLRTLVLDPLLPLHEQVQTLFKQSKKLQAAVPHLQLQIKKREAICQTLQVDLEIIMGVESPDALEQWKQKYVQSVLLVKAKKTHEKQLPYHEFYSVSGLPIRVGKGAASNDKLTFQYAKGSDYWFHVRDYPGSHVVLVVNKGQKPDEPALQDAALLSLVYSKAREEKQAEVVMTQCKFVHKLPGGKPGKVQLGKQTVMIARQDPASLIRLRQRIGSPPHAPSRSY